MKFIKILQATSVAFFFAGSALAQTSGTVSNHAIAVGKGAGQTGFTSVSCADKLFLSGVSGLDPACRALVGADLPFPGVSTLGGVKSLAAATNQFLTGLGTDGALTRAQPAFSNLSGSATCSQLPAHTGDVTTSAGSCATAIGAGKVVSVMLGADVFSTAHSWSGQQTFVAPVLGTPASANLANATGLPIATGVSGLGTGVATFLATPSSANLRAVLTDEVGTGAAYFVGGALGTPASGTATNLTGLPISTGVSGLGTGIATFLATPSSANLAASVTNETGSGALVFGTSPVITTPTGIVKGDVGLGNVDNTSDATKWAATATLTNKTFDTAGTGNSFSINGVAATANTGTGAVVRAASPALTGAPTSTTATASDNSTRIATTAYVDAQVAGGVAGVASFKGRTGSVVPAQGDYSSNLIPGTATNDNATAGNIGEYVEGVIMAGSAVSLTSGSPTNITSISLTAGDWDVSGAITTSVSGANTTVLSGWVSTTSATVPNRPNGGGYTQISSAFAAGSNNTLPIGNMRVSIASTTTVFLTATVVFSGGTMGAYGIVRARRMR